MRSTPIFRPYVPVSSNEEHKQSSTYNRQQRVTSQYKFRPIPLWSIFLLSFAILLISCIVLLEVLLKNTVGPQSSVVATASGTQALTTRYNRPRRLSESRALEPRASSTASTASTASTYECSSTPTPVISTIQPRSSLCSEFSATFEASKANLSWPMQTSLSSWLLKYQAASAAGWNYGWYSDCPSTAAFGTFTRTIDVMCSLATVTVDYNGCLWFGTAWISNFALSSTSNGICGVSSQLVIDVNATPATNTVTSGASKVNVIDTATPSNTLPTITATTGAPKVSVIDTATPSNTLPTITVTSGASKVNVIDTATPSNSLPTITKPAGTSSVSPANAPTQPLASKTTPAAFSSSAIANSEAPSSAAMLSAPESSRTVAVAPIPVTLVTTNSQGEVQTIVTQAYPAAAASATFLVTDTGGSVGTITTQLPALIGPSATIVTTNSQGAAETMVVAANELQSITSSIVFTNSNGEVQTSTAVAYALVGSFGTYTTTDSLGQVQTVVSKTADQGSSQSSYTTTTQYTSLVTTTNADGSVSTFSAVVVETVTLASSPTATKTSTATPSAISAAGLVLSSNEKFVNQKYSSTTYILAMYLPALIAVVIKALWEMVFAAVKLLEPFERMVTGTGTNAQYSIFAQYLSSSFSLDAFTSLKHANPLPLLSGLLFVVVQIGTPLAAASMTIKARSTCLVNGVQHRCDPTWVVNVPFLRGVEAALALCAILVLLVLWSTLKRPSAVPSDPSSLASLASLMTHEPLLRDIQKVDPDADHASFEASFVQHRFLLGYHHATAGNHSYGIIGLRDSASGTGESLPELDNHGFSTAYGTQIARSAYAYHTVHNPASSGLSSFAATSFASRLRKQLITDLIGFLFSLTLLTLVVTFYFDNSNDSLNRFFNSNTPAPKFLLVALATASSCGLSHTERLVRIAEPFRRLATSDPLPKRKSHVRYKPLSKTTSAPPETTLLINRSGTAYSTLPTNILLLIIHELHGGRMLFQTLMSLTVVVADLNIIAVAGVALNDAMTWNSYQWSSKISMALTAWLVVMYVAVLGWWKRNDAIRYIEGRSISKGVGTVGGCMRWLCGGERGLEVVAAVARVKEDKEAYGQRTRRRSYGYSSEAGGERGTSVWFGRTGVIGVSGRERWALMCDPLRRNSSWGGED